MKTKAALPSLLILLCSGTALAESMMSVKETIDFVKIVYCGTDGGTDGFEKESRRANPDARWTLHRMLKDPSQHDVWPQVVGSFAYLGRREDIPRLEAFLLSRQGVLDGHEYSAAMMVFDAYGGMGGRGVSEAKAKLKEMMTPEYWRDVRFQTRPYQPPGYPTLVNELRVAALRGYAYARASDFDKLAQALTSSIDDPHERENVEREVQSAAWLNREYRKSW